ncbi:MAG TPA: hypothetical protein VNV66_15840, partial [Pilimelia sp.]|nr:hypothetical protein [Pilimelia sp.]
MSPLRLSPLRLSTPRLSPRRRRTHIVALALLPALLVGAAPAAAAAGAGQGAPAAAGPAVPAELSARAGATSISLAWRQPTTGTPAVSFRVYDHNRLVARHTSTRVTLADLAFGSYHAITVTAVDAAGRESAPTPEIRLRAWVEGAPPNPCLPLPPMWWTVTATDVTATSAMLSWPSFMPGQYEVRLNGTAYQPTEPRGMRVGGLTPATEYEVQLARLGCGAPQVFGGGRFTTRAGRPAPPVP